MAFTTIHIIGQFANTMPLAIAENACCAGICHPKIAIKILKEGKIAVYEKKGVPYAC